MRQRIGWHLLGWRCSFGCIRHGHSLLCTSNDGHLCVRCGRHWL